MRSKTEVTRRGVVVPKISAKCLFVNRMICLCAVLLELGSWLCYCMLTVNSRHEVLTTDSIDNTSISCVVCWLTIYGGRL